MAQRISRAKQAIKSSSLSFALPTDAERQERLASVLQILYLIFNEGYASSAGPSLQRADLSTEAIRLTRLLHSLTPGDAEVTGLLSLMLLTDARRSARTGAHGELIPLDEQDRSQWDQALMAEGVSLVESAFRQRQVGPYQLQAAIAAVHGEAPSAERTDWPQILGLYRALERMTPNPMITLNRIIADAMVHGPEHGLRELSMLEGDARLKGHYRLEAVRAHLTERAGDRAGARALFASAAERTPSLPERDYLMMKAARLH